MADAGDAACRRVERESARLTRLVDDLLLARLDEHATAAQPRPAPMDLRTLAADALHDLRALAPDRDVTLTGPDGGPVTPAPVVADEQRLAQVVSNLVGNAVRHTPNGTPVRVGVGAVDGFAVLEVADRGAGLPPAQAERVFERFHRVDASRSSAGGGATFRLSFPRTADPGIGVRSFE